MQVCTSLQTDNHASTPPLSFFTGRMPFLLPNQQSQSTECSLIILITLTYLMELIFISWVVLTEHVDAMLQLLSLFVTILLLLLPSVLWRCWLGGRKGIRPVKNWMVGCWRGYLSKRGADLHVTQLMPLPLTVSCFSKIQIGLPFWYRLTRVVPEKGPLNGCVCVCVCVCLIIIIPVGAVLFTP